MNTLAENSDNEVWVNLTGFEGFYQVSSHGRIKSMERDNTNKKFGRLIPERVLSATHHYKNKYLSVLVKAGGICKRLTVHRQVAIHFVPNPFGLPEVNHEDGNKNNCHHANLKWCDRSYNNLHAFKTNLRTGINKGNFSRRYYNSKGIVLINQTSILEFPSIKSCARHFGVCHAAIQNSIKRNSEFKGHVIYV